jgi:hypothetical protein
MPVNLQTGTSPTETTGTESKHDREQRHREETFEMHQRHRREIWELQKRHNLESQSFQ